MHAPLHAGTHADSPYHYDPRGHASADCDLSVYIGPCLVVDARHAGARIEEDDLDRPTLAGAERVLFRTYEYFPLDRWDSDFTAIAPAVIARLRETGVRLIGTDAASLDPETSKTLDAHQEVKAGDMRILEGLVLDDVAPGRYELIALPLRIAGAAYNRFDIFDLRVNRATRAPATFQDGLAPPAFADGMTAEAVDVTGDMRDAG